MSSIKIMKRIISLAYVGLAFLTVIFIFLLSRSKGDEFVQYCLVLMVCGIGFLVLQYMNASLPPEK